MKGMCAITEKDKEKRIRVKKLISSMLNDMFDDCVNIDCTTCPLMKICNAFG